MNYKPTAVGGGTFTQSGLRIGSAAVLPVVLFLAVTLSIAAAWLDGSLVVLLFFLIFGSAGLAVARTHNAGHLYSIVYCVGVVGTVLIYWTYAARYGLPYYRGGSDDLAFELDALWLVESGGSLFYDPQSVRSALGEYQHNSPGYVYLLSLLIRACAWLGGFQTLVPRFLNCAALGLCAVTACAISRKLPAVSDRAATIGIAVGLLPMMVYVAAHTFRDTLIALILMLVLNETIVVASRYPLRRAILATVVVGLLSIVILEFRSMYVLVTIGMIAIAWYIRLAWRMPGSVLKGFLIAVGSMVLLAAFVLPQFGGIIGDIARYYNVYAEYRASLSDGLAQTLFSLPFPWNVVGRVGYAAVTPLPLLYASWEWTAVGAGTLLHFFFFPFVFLGIFVAYRERKYWPLVFGFAVLFSAYTFASFTFRHLAVVLPFAVILVALGWQHFYGVRWRILSTMAGILLIAAVAYPLLKGWI